MSIGKQASVFAVVGVAFAVAALFGDFETITNWFLGGFGAVFLVLALFASAVAVVREDSDDMDARR